eukprot:COSAG06_NODE_29642_length_552_cov_1.655629_1_plen_172_part_10
MHGMATRAGDTSRQSTRPHLRRPSQQPGGAIISKPDDDFLQPSSERVTAACLNGGRASPTFSASLHPPDNNHETTPRQLEMADTLAEIKEREFHARQAARGEKRHQRAAPSSQQRRSEPVGAGGCWLAIRILVALHVTTYGNARFMYTDTHYGNEQCCCPTNRSQHDMYASA